MTPQERKEYDKQWRNANPEKMKGYRDKWKKKYPERRKTSRKKSNKKYLAKFSGPSNNKNHRQRWTIIDINLILSSTLTVRELHNLIGRSIRAIATMRYKMKERR